MVQKRRLSYITVLRCITVILVVFGHSICMYTGKWRVLGNNIQIQFWQNTIDVIYSIHMPIFTLISGYIYWYNRKLNGGYNNLSFFIKKKIFRILIPFIIFGVIECTIDMGCRYKYVLIGPLHIWYLRFILECFLITRLMDKCFLGRPFILLIFVIFQYLFFDVLEYHTLDIPFDTNYRYFILGMFCLELVERYKVKKEIVACAVVILFTLFIFVIRVSPHFFVTAFTMCLNCSILLFFSTLKFHESLPCWITNLDKCSMGIYLIHHPIIWNIAKYNYKRKIMEVHYITGPIIVSLIALLLSWFISSYVKKNKYLHYILG